MPSLRLLAAGAGTLALAVPSVAHAGGLTNDGAAITFTGGAGAESVTFSSEGGKTAVRTMVDMVPLMGLHIGRRSRRPVEPGAGASVTTLGADDTIDARNITDGSTLTAAGGGSGCMSGTKNADGSRARPATTDSSAGTATTPSTAAQAATASRTRAATTPSSAARTTTAGRPGLAGHVRRRRRGRLVQLLRADRSGHDHTRRRCRRRRGGRGRQRRRRRRGRDRRHGADRIVGNALGTRLHGGAGNDSITGGPAEDRLEGNEGDDTIDSRDGRFDSIDCGPGTDTLLADPGDGDQLRDRARPRRRRHAQRGRLRARQRGY